MLHFIVTILLLSCTWQSRAFQGPEFKPAERLIKRFRTHILPNIKTSHSFLSQIRSFKDMEGCQEKVTAEMQHLLEKYKDDKEELGKLLEQVLAVGFSKKEEDEMLKMIKDANEAIKKLELTIPDLKILHKSFMFVILSSICVSSLGIAGGGRGSTDDESCEDIMDHAFKNPLLNLISQTIERPVIARVIARKKGKP